MLIRELPPCLAAVDAAALLQWLGRTHVVVVHFPIALLLVAGLAELWRALRGAREASKFSVGCVALGTLAAVWAVVAGLVHAGHSDFRGDAAETLARHQWLGIAAAVAGVAALLCLRARPPLWPWRLATLAGAALVGAAGHLGGTLTHGPGYLTEMFTAPAAAAVASAPAKKTPAAAAIKFPADGRIDFVRHVQPILAESCNECHGPTVRRGGLRLDSKASALKGGKGGPAVVPRDGAHSTLLARIAADVEPAKRMPQKKPALPAEHARILAAWIAQGAPWPDTASYEGGVEKKHWAYAPVSRAAPPAPRDAAWAKNPIDAFILARLDAERLAPSPAADRATLLRRVSLDLTGLPPSPAEADEFLSDLRPDAYERAVDRLLASPHYGERWARPWLDLARYADSNGYEKDRLRSIWPWRDWVVDALNRDLPFDQFTIEQLAGDLLSGATLAQKVATGFHRNTMLNQEGGTDPEEFRNLAVVDRVNTTATVWLGSTLACAQCHDHKFDAFSQQEYFQLFSFFNQTADESKSIKGSEIIDISPKLELPRASEAPLHARLAELEKTVAAADLGASLVAWEKSLAAPGWVALTVEKAHASGQDVTLTPQPDGTVLATGSTATPVAYYVTGHTSLARVTALRLEVLPDPAFPGGGPGRGEDGAFVLNKFNASVGYGADAEYAKPTALHLAMADYAEDYATVAGIVSEQTEAKNHWTVRRAGAPAHATFVFDEPPVQTGGLSFTLALNHLPKNGGAIGRLRVSATGADLVAHATPPDVTAVLATAAAARTAAQQAVLAGWFRTVAPSLAPVRRELAALRAQLATPITTLVLEERKEPRATFVHQRGNFLSPGARVSPGVPAVLPPLAPDAPRDRLGLARWLVSPENPLTPRVTVNRMWEAFFGRGLVLTSEDFGIQGAEPTHPALLDWLAGEFVRGGWGVKRLHRLIVTSATYRQSSALTPALAERDPANTLLARGPRFRLEAELIRDQALAAAGLLSEKMGGPGVFPSQPANIWSMAYNVDKWTPSAGEDRLRRGLYTIWRRSAPYPSFLSFDATTREAICTRRSRSNTALQALTTLNDPQFFEAAVGLARRLLREGGADAGARATLAFRLCAVRLPKSEELGRLLALYREQRENFARDGAAAARLVGPYLPEGEPATAELAAWTMVANVLLNLDETLTKS